jgi:predicted Zn-dependent protease
VIARVGAFLFLLVLTNGAAAQEVCPLPPALQPISHQQDIFTDGQESDLGDILAQFLVEDEAVLQDDLLSAHLRETVTNLARYLPENHFRLHFLLIDIPEANAFSLPGGRVYISRKLIGSLKNEDELAAILAHELGHVVTHQTAIFMTQVFHEVLGANSVTDRADIEEKIHRIHETWAMHKVHIRDTDREDQLTADQVAL